MPGSKRQRVFAICAALLLVTMAVLGQRFASQRDVPVAAGGIALSASGQIGPVSGARLVSATEQDWLSDGTIPITPAGVDPDLTRDALLDLRTLSGSSGVTIAAWNRPGWRYVWPRDSAFVAAAFARTGHLTEAERQLTFLQQVQSPDGTFQARYVVETGRPPDDRGVELDGSGWAVWALDQVVQTVPIADRAAVIERYRELLDRSVAASVTSLDPDSALPPPSLDYWEVEETRTTLATAAVLLAGLRAASRLYAAVDDPAAVERADRAADALQGAIIDRFEPDGYPRREGGSARSVDLGVSFLLAPYARMDRDQTIAVWSSARKRMARPAGGLAPGGSWRNDGISWTPTVGSYAVAASCVEPAVAREQLGWLASHRTSNGSLPEKVLADGRPASVAPLAWTAAAVVIAADQLDRGCAL